jgi:hypothetical protein
VFTRGANRTRARGPSTSPLEAGAVPDLLVYQPSDPRFADRAVEAMSQAGISAFRSGSGYADLRPGIRQDLASAVCIYMRRQEDYARANGSLRELDAAPKTVCARGAW